MDPVQVGSDDRVAEYAVYGRGQPDVGWVQSVITTSSSS